MKLASIERIKEVVHHSNADVLDIVKVLNYQCIVKRDQYKAGDLVVFIQPDTVLPDAEWTAFYKAKSNRVKAIRLRGVFSFGIVESLNILKCSSVKEGDDISEILNITKYEPPIPQDLDAKGSLPYGLSKTDETRWQNLESIPYGEIVNISLKIDGSSESVYCKRVGDEWVTGITTRSMDLKPESINKYTTVAAKYDLVNKHKGYCKKHNINLALRGECYGSGIQGSSINPHAKKPLGFALFSVYNFDTLQYEGTESPHYYEKVAKELDIETVPLIEKDVVLTPELIRKYSEEIDNINGVPFEGVVIKMRGGRSFKIINLNYDQKK